MNKINVFLVIVLLLAITSFVTLNFDSGQTIAGEGTNWWTIFEQLNPFAITAPYLAYTSGEETYSASGFQVERYGWIRDMATNKPQTAILRINYSPVLENSSNYYVNARGLRGYSGTMSYLYYTDKCFSSWSSFWSSANCSSLGCSGLSSVGSGNDVSHTKNLLSKSTPGNYSGCPTYVYWTNATSNLGMWIATGEGQKNTVLTVAECDSGETKCDGTTYYTCSNSKWFYEGQVSGQCGYTAPECSAGEQSCIGDTLKYCSNGQWYYENNSSQCFSPECSEGETSCDGTTLKYCNNGLWAYNSNDTSCAIIETCVQGEDKCIGSDVYVCSNNDWVNFGQVVGECGVGTPECSSEQPSCEGTSLKSCVNGFWDYEANSVSCQVSPEVCNVNIDSFKCVGLYTSVCSNNVWSEPQAVDGFCGYDAPIEEQFDVYFIAGILLLIIFGISGALIYFNFTKKKGKKRRR